MKYVKKYNRNFRLWAFIGFAALTSISLHAEAACYDFSVKEDIAHELNPQTRTEKWCYEQNSVLGETFIFNADQDLVNPELAMLIEKNGLLTHGSLLNGKLTLHKVHSDDFNPFSVPINEPTNTETAAVDPSKMQNLISSSLAVQNLFRDYVGTVNTTSLTPLAAATSLPWRGYWWPRKGTPMVAPLVKYDNYVSRREANPGAAAWERARHGYTGVNWAGHCNGWAAASILRSEPQVAKTDPTSGVTFSVSDQKGLLAELDYCVSVAFFGNRNYGSGNNGDIRPELFHKTVLYYIGSLKKPVIMDYRSDASVDNHVVSAYSMQIQQNGANSQIVTATMTFHGYDKAATNSVGVAPRYTRVYKYRLTTDASGRAIGGSWISGNPDFIWVPLSPARCSSNNPRLSSQWVSSILGM